ncbi:MAG: hypothetical protein ACI9K5_002516 [Gammaproteobacteria bacterium]|jgi:uncharacterized protein involved in exopolysaccharide biosynthesis
MNPLSLLQKADLTPEEEAALDRELSAAYLVDEAAATSDEVRRIAEKIRLRMSAARDQDHPPDQSPGSGSAD